MISLLDAEKELFSKGYYQDIYNYLSTSEETINLVNAIDYMNFKNYVKKDTSMFLLQMLVVNYFSTEQFFYNPQKDWRIPYEHRLRSFLQDSYDFCLEHSDLFQNISGKNPFLTMRGLVLTPLGYKILRLSNLFFTELYRDTKKEFMNLNVSDVWSILLSKTHNSLMKKYYKIFITIFQTLYREGCPKGVSKCSELFSPYSDVEGYKERDESYARCKMKEFIGNLLIFSYTCNNGLIIPRLSKKGLKESNSSVDTLLRIYNGESLFRPSSNDIWYSIEKALPDLTNLLSKLDTDFALDVRDIKDILHKNYDFPETIFDALSWKEFADLVGSTWKIPEKCSKYRVHGAPDIYVTAEEAWSWQQIAIIKFFCREFFKPNDFSFNSAVKIRRDTDVRKCIQEISKFVMDNSEILDKIKPYTGYLSEGSAYSKNVQKNLIIVNKILKIIHSKVKEYNQIYKELPKEESNSWGHFFKLYKNSWELEIKKSNVLNDFFVTDDYTNYSEFFSSKNFLNFLKIAIFFKYTIQIMEKETPVEGFHNVGTINKIREIWWNTSHLQDCLDEIMGSTVGHKYSIPEGFKEAHAKYYSKEISMYEFSNMFHVSDSKIREWMKECNLPVRPRGIKKDKTILELLSTCEKTPQIEPVTVLLDSSVDTHSVVASEDSIVLPAVPVKENMFSFSLFGHKLTIRSPFKVEKIEQSASTYTSDDFDDFVEY